MSFGRKVFEANSIRPGSKVCEARVQGVDDEDIEAEECEETRAHCRVVLNRSCIR